MLGHEDGKGVSPSLIDEIVREGARRMLAEALQAEVDAYIAVHTAERDENGRRLVVRNGSHQSREVLTSAGAIEVSVPRVNDKRTDPGTGERQRFSSAILPPWCRKTPKITEVLPLLYLHGLSSGDFVPALGQFLGSSAGLSAAVITRLTETWKGEQRAFAARDLSGVDYVYLWAVLAVGDGALGFWNALREVFPQAREGRCWFHKTGNVLAALSKSAQPGAKKAPAQIWGRPGWRWRSS
jgi:transposase-like protein